MRKIKIIAALIFMLCFRDKLHADHFFGADIAYRCIDTNTGKYRFTATLYRSCSGITFFINKKWFYKI